MKNDVSKKKKNSKEKRILIASLCIAAAVIAGSTFAWFSSTDEVTNRLTANADYGVSIVESFAPPANWLPGQAVNKDVYATNTGNIGAFVEEDISGVLTITTEKSEATWSADCVVLTDEERYSMEAGSFLALKPAGDTTNQLGNQVVIRPGDQGTPPTTDFTPAAEGLYVFRRQIVVDNPSRAETFEYAGYYYTAGKYYKVSLDSVTPDATPDFANDGLVTDGILSAATASYYKEVKEVVNPVDLEYDADNNRLIASYNTGNTSADNLIAKAQAYDDAIAAYERASEAVTRATADSTAANATLATQQAALDTATADLQAALAAQSAAAATLANATAAYNNAVAAQSAAQSAVDASKTRLYGAANGTESSATAGSLKKNYTDATAALVATNGRDQFENDFNAWAPSNQNAKGTSTLADYTYDEFMHFTPNDQNQVYYQRVAAEKRAKEAYEAELTKLIGGTDPSAAPTADSLQGKLNAANDTLGDASSGATKAMNDATADKANADQAVSDAQTAYNTALGNYNTAATNSGTDTTNLNTAIANLAAASAAKNAAQAAYEAALNETPSDGILKVNIYLSDDVVTAGGEADKWQLSPNPISDDVAKFYYTSILDGGETSSKLVDRVELDGSATQDMYKSFDFDVNVALKSAQITYAEDNETILGTAATSELNKTPTLTDPKDINTALTWN
ncbi:BsaA family SipW-dependent biofilm matrix protein [Ruminococcus sp.]|uniref:BsaA family SipW-dependent biofilm matrix protein n=1 Tax=Ruminococcus sp. TaxID=41978 RepID=UPI0025EF88C6|nr:BsaA family SipW-dependent biofilm matrix protein [Ruminococcus sp.]